MAEHEAWAPDPSGRNELRWWDGFRWTDHVANGGVVGTDPVTEPPTAVPASGAGAVAVTGPMGGGWPTFPVQTQGPLRDPRASWVSFPDAIKRGFVRYADFTGRASRSEYWWWVLFSWIVYAAVSLLILSVIAGTGGSEVVTLLSLVWLGLLLPTLAVGVRRLHDVGQPGWWLLIALVPFGGIVLFVFSVLESQPHENAYGPPPSSDAG